MTEYKFHILHDRINNRGRYVIARESEREVRYWNGDTKAWAYYPACTLYPSKSKAERELKVATAPLLRT